MPPSARIYDFCGLPVASTIPLPQLRGAAGPPRCTVTLDARGRPLAGVEWFHEWRKPRGPRWLRFGRVGDGYVLRFPGLADFIVNAAATRIAARPAPGLSTDTLRHLVIDQVLPLAASRQGRLALHASAVHLAGIGTIGFVGEAGRGKSTLAAALAARGARIVTDDCLTIESRGGVMRAIPGYPGLRLWPGPIEAAMMPRARRGPVAHYSTKQRLRRGAAFRRAPGPLRALFLLSPRAAAGAAASTRVLRASTRLMGLLRFGYLLDVEDRRDLARQFAGLSAVVATVPVLRLRVRHGSRYLPAAAALIEAFAARA